MFAPFLLTMALASAYADDQSDVVALIGGLGAQSFDDRVAAYKALERIGREALPALRAAADTGDTRARSRARALIESIGRQVESDRFTRPTLLRLDFRNRPLGEVVDALNDRYDLGLSLRLGPDPNIGMVVIDPDQPMRLRELKGREITLEAAQPVPFWKAIDRICYARALRYDETSRQRFWPGQGFLFLMADRTGRGPVSDSGPFRVQITGVRFVFRRDATVDPDQARREAQPPNAGNLIVALTVLPEPGVMLYPNGLAIVTEATDDRGRSLAPAGPSQREPSQNRESYQNMNEQAAIDVGAFLVAPDPPEKVIRRLRGKAPVIAVTRGSDPIVIRLMGDGAVARSFSTRDMTLVVDEAVLGPGAQASVKLTIRANRDGLAAGARSDPHRPNFAGFNRDRVCEHLELYDDAGRRLNYIRGGGLSGADSQGFYDRYRLIVSPVFEDYFRSCRRLQEPRRL